MNKKKAKMCENIHASIFFSMVVGLYVIIVLGKRGFFPAYHMNKKSWVTIIFDDTVADEEIKNLLENSYQSVK